MNDTTIATTIGNLGMTDVKFPAPVFEGDTIGVTTEIMAKRESKSRSDAGIVDFHHRALQAGRHAGRRMPASGFHAENALSDTVEV